MATTAAPPGASAGARSVVYRPRHPERTAFYKLLEKHFDEYVRVYDERFEPQWGPLRRVVQPTVEAFLACGRLHGGFARLRCPKCKGEHLLAFSCQTRNFCGSCQAKRAALLGEKLVEEICAPVAHRHVVLTIPRALRGLFRRDRKLLGLLARCAWEAILRTYRACLGDPRLRPGAVLALQTFGAYAANFHPHVHVLITDGAFAPDGTFHELPQLDPRLLEELFRRLVLQRLHAAGRLSEEFRDNLLSWRRSGFSVGADQRVEAGDRARLERLARYIARGPLPLDRVRVADGRVLVTTPPDPRTGATELALDPLDFVHAVTEQIPDVGQHLIRYFGWYASRTRGCRRAATNPAPSESTPANVPRAPPAGGRRQSWARMLRRILETDPLLCPRCGAELKLLAVLTDPDVVFRIARRIEAGAGDDPFEARAPPDSPVQLS